jgi:signal transduction histidine kinase
MGIFPLRAKEKLLGTLRLATRRGPRPFTRNERELLRAISDHAAVAIENARLYAEASRRVDEIETLFAVGQAIASRLDPNAVLQLIADEARRLTSSRAAVAFLLEGDELQLCVLSGEDILDVSVGYRLPVADSLTGLTFELRQPLRVADAQSDPRPYADLVQRMGMRSLMVVPLISGSRPIGSISVANKIAGTFGLEDERVLTMLASAAVIALENARLYEAEQRRAEQFRVISEVGGHITSILTVDELLAEMSRLIKEAFNYYRVVIGLVEGDELIFSSGAGDSQLQPARLKVGQEGIVGWVAATGEPLLVTDVRQEPRYYSRPQTSKTRSELTVPIKAKKAIIGVLDVQSDRLDAFDESDLAVLQSLAHQAAIAIENARLYERAQQLAIVEERNRLARELHDSATQSVYGVTMFAEAATRLLTAGQAELAADHMREVRKTAQKALQEMRLLIFELRPPILEKEGLVAALQTRLEAVEARSGLQTEFKTDGVVNLSSEIEEGLYRITQEALNNALKHAQAQKVAVHLYGDQHSVIVEIIDDGIGYDPDEISSKGGMGLQGIEERVALLGGQLRVSSKPGGGTIVRVEVRRRGT